MGHNQTEMGVAHMHIRDPALSRYQSLETERRVVDVRVDVREVKCGRAQIRTDQQGIAAV